MRAAGDDDGAFLEEEIDKLHGLIELAAGVPAEVKNQSAHALFEK